MVVSMPIGIIPMLRPTRVREAHRQRLRVSMPIGIIPMLRRPTRSRATARRRRSFNAYRHYPYVETTAHGRRRPRAVRFNAYRHYPYVETRLRMTRSIALIGPSFNAYRHYPYVETPGRGPERALWW